MRKIGFALVSILILLCLGCQRQAETVDVLDVESPAASESSSSGAALDGKGLEIVNTACYVFEEGGESQLYTAIEYTNSGSSPLYLEKADLKLSSAQSASYELEPVLASYNVLLPGERAYAAAWFPAEGMASSGDLSLEAVAHGASGASSSIPLEVRDVFFADNYPGFTTMTGTLINNSEQSCSLNMVYAGLYDADENFLGAWFFSQNAQLDTGDSVRFTTHLKAFPVNKLTEKGVHSQCRAFGFN